MIAAAAMRGRSSRAGRRRRIDQISMSRGPIAIWRRNSAPQNRRDLNKD
jgi:hypothetical protein